MYNINVLKSYLELFHTRVLEWKFITIDNILITADLMAKHFI